MFGLGGQELLIVLVVVGLLFGAKKLPEFAKSIGEGIREFKKSTSMTDDESKHVS